MQILHFSDTHANGIAVLAVAEVCQRWNEAYVCLTGDVSNPHRNPDFSDLPNPRPIWLVRGHHDKFPVLNGLPTDVIWDAPYSGVLPCCAMVGLDFEMEIEPQLEALRANLQGAEKGVLVVLCHVPYKLKDEELIVSWAKDNFQGLVSVILLHGHEHYGENFFAEAYVKPCQGIQLINSHVYSANVGLHRYSPKNRKVKIGIPGCANLLTIKPSGQVKVQTVYDPAGIDVRDNRLILMSEVELMPESRWRIDESGPEAGLPVYLLEKNEDPLEVIDKYWRWFAKEGRLLSLK